MNKRGQFYILAIFIASVLMYGLVIETNSIKEPEIFYDFSDLSKNYITESNAVVNYALRQEVDVQDNVNSYNENFLDYAHLKNPSFALLTVYVDESGVVTLANWLDPTTPVKLLDSSLDEIFSAQADSLQEANVDINGNEFIFQFPLELKNFGDGFFTAGDVVDVSIGGIVHNFDITPGVIGPKFEYYLTADTDESVMVYEGGGDGDFIP